MISLLMHMRAIEGAGRLGVTFREGLRNEVCQVASVNRDIVMHDNVYCPGSNRNVNVLCLIHYVYQGLIPQPT